MKGYKKLNIPNNRTAQLRQIAKIREDSQLQELDPPFTELETKALTWEMVKASLDKMEERQKLVYKDHLIHIEYTKNNGLPFVSRSLFCPCEECVGYREFARSYLGPSLFEHWKSKMFADVEETVSSSTT